MDLRGQRGLLQWVCETGDFVRRFRIHARFGELSRAPLHLLRLELCGEIAECDWIARAPDPWDKELPLSTGERHASMQALQDAVTVRDLLFCTVPNLRNAEIRVYHWGADVPSSLIITGVVAQEASVPKGVRSAVMRAKLIGLRFWLEEGVLKTLEREEHAAPSLPVHESRCRGAPSS